MKEAIGIDLAAFISGYAAAKDTMLDEKESAKKKVVQVSMKKYYTVESLLGGKNIYDESGKLVGYSVKSALGGEDFYVVSGKLAGYSVDSVFGGEDYYNGSGSPAGFSTTSLFGGENIYNSHGQLSGYTVDGLFGGKDGFFNDNLFDESKDS